MPKLTRLLSGMDGCTDDKVRKSLFLRLKD